jgi:nucleoside-diphosphate-sugar epimerase
MSTQKERSVLVLGANGRLGHAAMLAFAAAGWRVLAQARRPLTRMPANVQQLAIALAETDALAAAAAKVSAVVYAVNPIYTEWDAKLLPLAKFGMDLAQRLGALFMLPGNVYGFGEQMPRVLLESTPQRPTTGKGHLRLALEADMQVRANLAQDGLHGVVVRAGDFFGAGTGSWFDQAIVKSLARGKLVYPGPLDRVHAWAYLPDLARTFVSVADAHVETASIRSGSFENVHFLGHNITGAELLAAIERAAVSQKIAAQGTIKRSGFPWAVIRAGGLVYPLWRELGKMEYLWRVPHAVESTTQHSHAHVTPLDDAITATLIDLALSAPPSSARTPITSSSN